MGKETIKECFTTIKQVFFSYTTDGFLVDTKAYQPYTLVGPPVWRPLLAPLAANTSTTVYISNDLMFSSINT